MKRPVATNSLILKQELISYTVPKKTILRVWFKKPINKPIRFFILCFKKLIFALVRKNRWLISSKKKFLYFWKKIGNVFFQMLFCNIIKHQSFCFFTFHFFFSIFIQSLFFSFSEIFISFATIFLLSVFFFFSKILIPITRLF